MGLRMISRAFFPFVLLVALASSARAEEADPTQKALAEITDTADRICNVVKLEGSAQRY